MMLPKLFLFYLLIFAIIFYLKHLFSTRVILNTIWFSYDGTIPETAIENLTNIKSKINQSPYKKNYKICLWTDKTLLNKNSKKILKKNKIIIMDYQKNIKIRDAASLAIINWINKLIRIDSKHTKLHLAMASDMFRLFLLTKQLPRKYPRAISIYLDCNDMTLDEVPTPKSLRELKGIAFSLFKMTYNFPAIKKLKNTKSSQHWFNNDIIIANHLNNQKFLNIIFQSYYDYLHNIKNIIDTYIESGNNSEKISNEAQILFVFATTHPINFLCQQGEDARNVFLLNDVTRRIEGICSASSFIRVSRINTSLSWVKNDTNAGIYSDKILELCQPLLRN